MTETYAVKVRPEKVEAVDEIKQEIGETQAVVLTEYRGLTVNDLAELRAKLRVEETSYRIVKNTLARRAADHLGLGEINELFAGPVAVAYCKGDPIAAAKILAAFAREHPDLVIKGGVLDGKILSADEAKDLAKIDSLVVSRAKIAGMLTAPLRRLVFLLEAPASRIIYVLDQIGSRAETEAPAPDEAPPEAEALPSDEEPAEQTAPEAETASEEAVEQMEEQKEGE